MVPLDTLERSKRSSVIHVRHSTGSPSTRPALFSLEHTVPWLLPYSGSEQQTKTRRDRVVHLDHDECHLDKTVTEDWPRHAVGEMSSCYQLVCQRAELLNDTQLRKESIHGKTRS